MKIKTKNTKSQKTKKKIDFQKSPQELDISNSLLFYPEIKQTFWGNRKETKEHKANEKMFAVNANAGAVEKKIREPSSPSTERYGSSILRPMINANKFKLKSAMIQMI